MKSYMMTSIYNIHTVHTVFNLGENITTLDLCICHSDESSASL
jgi:hypothetical protein